jgi:c-di-GMP-binding flagellar brake protein YcgR
MIKSAAPGGSPDLKKCWTRDLSPGGARLMCLEPIDENRVLLKFLLPKLGKQFIEAQIVSRSTEEQRDIRNHVTTFYYYGVQFVKVLDEADTLDAFLG